mgnify:CR=1 FL=1
MKITHIVLTGTVTDYWSYQDNLLPKYHKKNGYDVSIITSHFVYKENGKIGIDNRTTYINENGIRSGVISNIGWSGEALTSRINRLLPENTFEFIIASSDYMFRKPNPMLFELALKKAGLQPGDVWFCGDNVKADVVGSAQVGIFPIWYEDETMENPWRAKDDGNVPNCKHLHIHDWLELIEALEEFNE